MRRYRDLLAGVDGVALPYTDADVGSSSCYVMPVVLEEPGLQGPLRELMRDRWGIQTSLLYPSISEFTAYRAESAGVPRSEMLARTEVTIPLYPHLTETDQDRVVSALREGLVELRGG